ncbi:hypothetical protein POSPLADRAFT_1032348 [Postia placenta MAD-698-R-SB12]|uniref:Uncharacterized protein n=1 Tax=Postia placenta MAD-698-R-SB12 TaxID=670580 RepID=A0A1X6N5Q4_9APHY|nr:hypothetical protein POSPLADRAFT_1032348 [Postia placenta MAD-698-R-SB12]OSX63802.1 hypothetical protein POSPLADRAFT_1032348 [Postia placenta MAD-698-R-SB12]
MYDLSFAFALLKWDAYQHQASTYWAPCEGCEWCRGGMIRYQGDVSSPARQQGRNGIGRCADRVRGTLSDARCEIQRAWAQNGRWSWAARLPARSLMRPRRAATSAGDAPSVAGGGARGATGALDQSGGAACPGRIGPDFNYVSQTQRRRSDAIQIRGVPGLGAAVQLPGGASQGRGGTRALTDHGRPSKEPFRRTTTVHQTPAYQPARTRRPRRPSPVLTRGGADDAARARCEGEKSDARRRGHNEFFI